MAAGIVQNVNVMSRWVLSAIMLLMTASLASCEEPSRPGLERVKIKGETFWLEGALDSPTRIKGLGQRESIPKDGGMIFVFPTSERLEFVMRDCTFDIDIAFLDDTGRVVAIHTMVVEPKLPGESDIVYENRLKRYSSRFASRMAVEVQAGTFARLGLQTGDMIELDAAGLKMRTK